MTTHRRSSLNLASLATIAGALFLAAPLHAQSFTMRVQSGNDSTLASSGTSLAFRSPIGESKSISIALTYSGSAAADLTSISLSGSNDFQFQSQPPYPTTLLTGQTANIYLKFTPTTSTSTLSQLQVLVKEHAVDTTASTVVVPSLVTLGLIGTAPEIQYAYSLQTNSNVLPIADGGTVTFEATTINTLAYSYIVAVNKGSAPATLESVTLSGDSAFDLMSLPLLPTTVAAGSNSQFVVRYSPKTIGSNTATIALTSNGKTSTFTIQATAKGPSYTYELISDSADIPATVITTDSAITIPDTDVNRKSLVYLKMTNSGTDDGIIAALALSGTGFSLIDPPITQFKLKPAQSVVFGIQFNPLVTGKATGRLRIDADAFNLVALATGPQLEYSYAASTSVVSVIPSGLVVLPSTAVGQTTATTFTLKNTGNRSSTIPAISLSGNTSAFRLETLPAMPLVLDAGQSASFTVKFNPTFQGPSTDILTVGNVFFNLSASAASLPALPSYRFDGPSGTVEPMQQPAVSLTLAEAYPVALIGTLTLSVSSDSFSSDPAVQFAAGGRVVTFTIPAGTTKAIFSNGSSSIRFQTGTAAGSILFTPAFATDNGINRTPTSPTLLTLTVAPSVPRLLDLRQVVTATGVQYVVTGYTTPRNLKKIDLTITTTDGKANPFSFTLDTTATLWFNSTSSQNYGGLFSILIPFTVTGTVDERSAYIAQIASISATATNDRGASTALSVKLQ